MYVCVRSLDIRDTGIQLVYSHLQLSRVQKACFDALVQALVGLGGELELDEVWFAALYTVQLVSGALAGIGRPAPYASIRLPPLELNFVAPTAQVCSTVLLLVLLM